MITGKQHATLMNLTEAQELIRDPKNWTQLQYARDAEGGFVDPCSPEAVSWCAKGALYAAGLEQPSFIMIEKAFRQLKIEEEYHYRNIMYLNDDGGHDLIMKLYDRAKELCVETVE